MVRSVIAVSSLVLAVAFTVGGSGNSARVVERGATEPSGRTVELEQRSPAVVDGSSTLELSQCLPRWNVPVTANVVDPFRQPETRFTAGNRGLEFDTNGGESVKAVEGGDVVFAGPVGGRRFVVVLHSDGMKSTYAYLTETKVAAGAEVERGEVVGFAGTGFHLTARADGRYLDPQAFFSSCRQRVRLVPTQEWG